MAIRLSPALLVLLFALPASSADPWWAVRPLKQPAPPAVAPDDAPRVRTPIDRFVFAKLREKGLAPSREADMRVLLRRVTFDLTGLPPTPAEIDAFLADNSPGAYEKQVDRLLASPAYGERWARHWMDAVHFAETHGHDQDRVRPNAWRYRDYLIAAFNSDTPYPRFVREQIAADVLYPDEPRQIPALGLLAAGPWDESSLRDIREDSIDRQVGYYLDRDDMVTTVMATFTSLTAHCARCHDHKFDPISQTDYYRLQAVFAGVGRADRAFDADPTVAKKRSELKTTLAALDRDDAALLARVRAADFRKDVASWEAKQKEGVRWQTLDVASAASTQGATLTTLPDGSVRSEGNRPERDTYSVTTRSRLNGITAVRLELLTDDSLPHHGPGRQDNGNLHLSEIRIAARTTGDAKAVDLLPPASDYDQPGWTVKHAVDGNPATAWGIYPQVGRRHAAVFPFKHPLGDGGEVELAIALDQLHGGGHLIGRFRLSATTSANPVDAAPLPDPLPAILDTDAAKRTPEQQDRLGLYVLRAKASAEMETLPAPLPVYAAAADFAPDGSHKPVATPRPVYVLRRGDIHSPLAEVQPGALSCIPGLPGAFDLPSNHREGVRRAALAKWLTDPKNVLTWRSIVNRVWHYHFGRGIVDTPNDFGKMGGTPTHPELLDWLAVEFQNQGGSIKKLHRLVVTSSVYRQSSAHNAQFARLDADNRCLWRMPRDRLEAEEVRDAILLAADRLDRRMGGPSDQQFAMKPGIHVTPFVEYGKFDWDRPQGHRRSVYRFVFRTLPDPFVECLDGAEASQLAPVRNVSVTAPQSLALFNNEFVLVHAKAMAASLEKQPPEERIATACRRLWGRPPTAAEAKEFESFATKHGLANLCRVLFNSNEFLFVD
jgi:hypothetical protein